MQKIDITSFPAPDQVKDNWQFAEVWIEPMLSPPYILLLLSNHSGNCCVYDPAKDYRIIFTSSTYEEAQLWLLEDEYEPLEGRLCASELQSD
ncbi:hypothetical protein ACE1AT_14015 [Pelatocladus sp. BLCC-F211]|uniref:hypothetical protein n=1 Tax=Pelatocladus sp. BLCC-F211 TaxID=3342752 RepID=UPI0035B89E53